MIEGSIEVVITMPRRREDIKESRLAGQGVTVTAAEAASVELEIGIQVDRAHRCRLSGEAETRA